MVMGMIRAMMMVMMVVQAMRAVIKQFCEDTAQTRSPNTG